MIYNKSNLLTAYFRPNNQLDPIQRQRSSIRRSNVLTMKTSNFVFTELNQLSINNNNNNYQQKIKRNIDRQSPILIRRHHRSTIENISPHQQSSDVFKNQLQLNIPFHSTCQNKSPRTSLLHSKPLHHSKTINEDTTKHIIFNSKSSHSIQTHIWTPTLMEKEMSPIRALRSKSHSLRHYNNHQLQIEKSYLNLKQNSITDLYISSKSITNDLEMLKKTNVKDLVDEWEDPKSNVAVLSDEEDSVVSNCNDPILTYNFQINIQDFGHFESSTFIPDQHPSFSCSSDDNYKWTSAKITNLRRRPYSIALPPVVEDVNDEEINDELY